jgi:hypothetical protein
MNCRFQRILILSAVLVLSAGVARAQQSPPPPPPDADMHGGPGGWVAPELGERIELMGFAGLHGGKVVTGAPLSAVAVSETTQTLSDGNQISRTTRANLFRDSQGRFRKEVTLSGFGPLTASGQPKSFVIINDPVASTNFVLHPDTKTAEQMPGHGKNGKKGPRNGGANGAFVEKWSAREQQLVAEGLLKKEDLGTQTIGGVTAQGTRITRTIPAGQLGNAKPINIVSERWYSNDLQMVVKSTRSDPRTGTTTYTLTNIQRTEPATSLFSVPSDYSVKQGGMTGMGRHGMAGGRQAPLAPPPDN